MTVLDDIKAVRHVDRFDMLKKLRETPQYILNALGQAESSGLESFSPRKYSSIVISGLGGSAIGGDIINDWLRELIDIPVIINRGYSLPAFVNKSTLLIAVSYSGNTFETLIQFEKAVERECAVYAITSNGKLQEKCVKSKVPHLQVPSGIPPRVALPYLLASVAYIMHLEGFISDLSDLENASKRMMKLGETIDLEVPIESNLCKKLALDLNGKLPLIFGLDRFAGIVRRFKCQLNENCKVQARYELAPELCHNEIESFRQASLNPPSLKVAVVILRNEVESRLETTLLEVLKEALEKSGLDAVYEVWGEGDTLEGILTSVYFIDYLTYYLAILRGVDPSPVASIEAFKGMLKEKM